MDSSWPQVAEIVTERLILEPRPNDSTGYGWLVRQRSSGESVGHISVFAVYGETELLWELLPECHDTGHTQEAVKAVGAWLREQGAQNLCAWIPVEDSASQAAAQSIGLSNGPEAGSGESCSWNERPS